MKDYSVFTITDYPVELQEIIIAKLSIFPFEAFEEKESSILAYIANEDIETSLQQDLNSILGDVSILIEKVPIINWNAKWEADFKAVLIDDFCHVRASFHPSITDVNHEIIINPKMAFGTAHHETTYMMIKAMQSIDIKGQEVFDYGCGTGILAILAAQMKAKRVDAIDYDLEAEKNTIENAALNNVSLNNIAKAELSEWNHGPYDIILANINRNVLIENVLSLNNALKTGGKLLVSGVLKTDEVLVDGIYKESGFKLLNKQTRNDWICLLYESV